MNINIVYLWHEVTLFQFLESLCWNFYLTACDSTTYEIINYMSA